MIGNMTYGTIAYKLFKANFKKYVLFVVSNMLAIAILFSFLSLIFNERFMNPQFDDPLIGGAIYYPTQILFIFATLFLIYTQNAFIKSRQKDYGILLVLGMTEHDMRKNLLFEQCVLCIVYLLGGLLLGTLLSYTFFFVVRNIIGFSALEYQLTFRPYHIVIIFIICVFVITVLINLIMIIRSTIVEKLQSSEKTESKDRARIRYCLCGLILTVAAFIVLIMFYHINYSIASLTGMLLAVLGSALIFYNGEAIIEWLCRKHQTRYLHNLLLCSALKYYYGKNKIIFFAATWIFFTIIYFSAISLALIPYGPYSALIYQPFHLCYTEAEGFFKPLEEETIKQISIKHDNQITFSDKIEFCRDGFITIFCASDINRVLSQNYSVPDDSYIRVFPYNPQEASQDDLKLDFLNIDISMIDGSVKKLKMSQIIVSPLLGRINSISHVILLVNKDDFLKISQYSSNLITDMLHLYNFADWRKSAPIVKDVQDQLIEKNGMIASERYYRVSALITSFSNYSKTAIFFIFAILYISILLYAATILMVHFKLGMERDGDLRKFHILHQIGITDKEIKKIVFDKISLVFHIPLVYSVFIANLAYFYVSSVYENGWQVYSCLFSVALICLHIAVCKIYSFRSYMNTALTRNQAPR